MKILGVVVLFNPSDDVIKNISTYQCLVDKLLLIDNSTKPLSDEIKKYIDGDKIFYHSMNGNSGIAAALAFAMENSISEGYDYTLTMDQDSFFSYIDIEKVRSFLWENIESKYGIISLDTEGKFSDEKLHFVKSVITSGNFINNRNYKKIDGFNKDLFIDYVDFDLCRQFFNNKFLIVILPYSKANHTIGSPRIKKFFFIKIKSFNHSPIRYYYRYRNELYLYRKNKKYYFKMHLYEKINYIKMLICDDEVKEKKLFIKKAKKDAKKGKLGIYDYEK